jgi:hypothetical protein
VVADFEVEGVVEVALLVFREPGDVDLADG